MDLATLPRRAQQDRADRTLEALVSVAHHEPQAIQAARPERAQEVAGRTDV
jgi:hypothetical protein